MLKTLLHRLLPKSLRRRIDRALEQSRLAPISEQSAPFDTPEFLQQTRLLEDPFIREHALNVLERGFTVIPDSVAPALIDAAAESFREWKARNRSRFLPTFYKFEDRLDRIINIHAGLPEFRPLFSRNRALQVQDYLYQSPTALYTSLFFEVGSVQDVHRDVPYFWTRPANMYFGTWCALEPTDRENGPLVVVPGSHRLPLLDRDAIAREKYADLANIKNVDPDLWAIYQSRIGEMCRENGLKAEEVHVQKGDTIVWHPLLVHGGAPIIDPARTRLSFVVHTTPKNVPVFRSNVFFNVQKAVPDRAPWGYDEIDGRSMGQTGQLSIGHGSDFDFSQLT